MIPKKAGGWGALRKAVKKGHWLSDGDSIAKHVDNRQPDFDLCGHFSKDACCCCSCLVANGIERRRVCYSGRGGDTCCDCRRCCSSTICEIYSGYGLGSACCCLEKAGNCKCFIPNCCPRKREAKADLSFGPDAGGTMPPYETLCLKTACCCCSQGTGAAGACAQGGGSDAACCGGNPNRSWRYCSRCCIPLPGVSE